MRSRARFEKSCTNLAHFPRDLVSGTHHNRPRGDPLQRRRHRRAHERRRHEIVKADGYGHGLVPVARNAIAAGANWLGTAQLTEALALRRAGVTSPILAWLYAPGAPLR